MMPTMLSGVVRLPFVRGIITHAIDGRTKVGWQPTWYYVVQPFDETLRPHIIRHDELSSNGQEHEP